MHRPQSTVATANNPPPGVFTLIELPASYHGGSGAFSSAAGRSEMKKWSASEIKDCPGTKSSLPKPIKAGPNTDQVWRQARTTSLP